ncbi:MAG: hypothetical protein JW725_05485, partial [Candidatus Babeliaceae bacterium]|nr:hypothetical protein [Candidatus Babeliaceae bacterium]
AERRARGCGLLGMQTSERPLERLVRRKKSFGFIYVYIFPFSSVLAPIPGVMSKAQRRSFGGDSFFVLSPPNDLHNLRGQSPMPKT